MNLQKRLTREHHKLSDALGFITGAALREIADDEQRERITAAIQSGEATGRVVIEVGSQKLVMDLFGDGVVPFGFRVEG